MSFPTLRSFTHLFSDSNFAFLPFPNSPAKYCVRGHARNGFCTTRATAVWWGCFFSSKFFALAFSSRFFRVYFCFPLRFLFRTVTYPHCGVPSRVALWFNSCSVCLPRFPSLPCACRSRGRLSVTASLLENAIARWMKFNSSAPAAENADAD